MKSRLVGAVGIVAVVGGACGVLAAQTAASPAFEIASVKVSQPGPVSVSPYGQGRFTATRVSLRNLIGLAFKLSNSDSQIVGGPNWLDSERYDVNAKSEADVSLTYEQLQPRLQGLLAQRFKLAIHREMKDFQGYALVVANGGPKLKDATPGNSAGWAIVDNGVRNPNGSIDILASLLERPLGRPVVDKTGIKGNYDIALRYAPEGATDSPLPSVFTALQEQLGLKLETEKVPVEMLVIDHVEHPTEN